MDETQVDGAEGKYSQMLIEFMKSDKTSLSFPAYTSKKDRMVIHRICRNLSLYSGSVGEEPNRFLIVRKKGSSKIYDPKILQIFVKDFALPIPITESPYFEYFIDLYDEMYDTKNKLKMLDEVISKANIMKLSFTELYHKIREQMIESVKKTKEYKKFTELNIVNNTELPNNIQLYNVTDNTWPKYYISLDIIKANFNSMKYYNDSLVFNAVSWRDFVKKFTDLEYFMEAKYFRQIIFGNLNNKKSAIIQKVIMGQVCAAIKEFNSSNDNRVKVLGRLNTDELIIGSTEETIQQDYKDIMDIMNSLPEKISSIWRIEPIRIYPIEPTGSFAREKILDVDRPLDDSANFESEIKCARKDYFAQIFKHYYGKELHPYDLKTMMVGCIVTFDEPLIPK